MITMDLRDIIRDTLGAYRVQITRLHRHPALPDASVLDFRFRDQLYQSFDYTRFAENIIELVPDDVVIDYKDDFDLHYLVFRDRQDDDDTYVFCGPFVYKSFKEEDYDRLLRLHGLEANSIEALRWYFKRVPIIRDYLSWQNLLSSLFSRYLATPDLQFRSVVFNHPESAKPKVSFSLSSIPYSTVEARYAVENALFEAIRRGDISEATYQQNLFMGFTLDQRISDPLQDARYMLVAVNTNFRKAIEKAAVHPLYIDAISGRFAAEIAATQSQEEISALIPQMIRHYCLLVQQHSLARYSEQVRNCINYIDFHYMEPLNLEALATRFVINKNYLSSRFHREVGMTVTDYINKIRIQRASDMLRKENLTMQEIADQCGFSDANYFARTFRKITGQSPGEYRKTVQPGKKMK